MRALALVIALGGCDLVFTIRVPPDGNGTPPGDVPAVDTPADVGCSDKTREGFTDTFRFRRLAGCGGGFTIAGVDAIAPPACARAAGNDSNNPDGQGCNVEDLCASGWHVCLSRVDVGTSSALGCDDATLGANLFFVTRQAGSNGFCATSGLDDIYGCGTQGANLTGCAPLTRGSASLCVALPIGGWDCPDMLAEARTVTKLDPGGGGVLCCHD